MAQLSIHARWIVPVVSPPIENGRVVVDGGRIVSVEEGIPQPGDVDYGDAVVLPGFVNAHTHLELTRMRGRVPFDGSFVDWLRGIVILQMTEGGEQTVRAAVGEGLSQSAAVGVTTVVDIGCGQWTAEAWRATTVNLVGLSEVIGMGPRRFDPHTRSIDQVIAGCSAMLDGSHVVECSRLIYGISPHAPYSTAPDIYRRVIDYVRLRGLPIATHLAETREECEFLARGTGSFRELLEGLGLWDGSFSPPGCSPVEYAERLGLLECRPILAHVNYVSDSDIELLARYGAGVAYCPRTHEFFQHEPHQYRRMLERGVNVCLGTDSLASTGSLSILDELRFLRQMDSSLPSEVLLEMATIRGARAAGQERETGSIEAGKRADLTVIPLSEPSAACPIEDILSGIEAPAAVYVAGLPQAMSKLA